MARSTTITTDQIVSAAREVFLEKGIRATTAEVARRAGVAEGSIFKRFKTKEALFSAAMELEGTEPPWVKALNARADDEDVVSTLVEIGGQVLEFFRAIMPLLMMSWSNAGGLPEFLKQPNPPPMRALRGVTRFFEGQIQRGRLRRSDPEILARCYIGSLQNYVFFQMISRPDEPVLDEAKYLRGLVDLFWTGAAPDRSRSPEDGPRKARTRRRRDS